MLNRPGEEDYLQHANAAICGLTASFETEHVRRDGSRVELAVTLAPIRDSAATVTGVWCAARDVTARNEAERELERLTEATELTDAIISLDLDARVCHWSPVRSGCLAFVPRRSSAWGWMSWRAQRRARGRGRPVAAADAVGAGCRGAVRA